MRALLFCTVVTLPWTAETPIILRYQTAGIVDCEITNELRVRGPRFRACVDRLEMSARLARAEMRVNEGRRR